MDDVGRATAPLDENLLRLLACPVCHGVLALAPGGGILCQACARVYPIRDGLPILLAAAASLP